MKINYGPPGHKGVTQIMGLGSSSLVPQDANHRTVAGASVLTALAGIVLGNKTLRNLGIGGAVATLVTVHRMNKSLEGPLPAEPLPPSIQGWN